jgi:tetratricopeptide (TPR) repeat protein
MVDAHDRWDSTRVISLGEQAESDLAIIEFPLKERVQIEMLEMMARAFSRKAQYAKAKSYFEQLLSLFDPVEKHKEHTRTQLRIADMCIILKDTGEAKLLYEKVYAKGERDGNVEYRSKACMGLSRVEREAGNKDDAMKFAEQALIAADLMLEGDYGKDRNAAEAIIAIVDLSDITSESFDENLLARLEVLTTAVDANEHGGSSLCVKAAELQCSREFAMSRWSQCANACVKTMRLASQTRFKQNPDVQKVYKKALETIETLYELGFIEKNAENQ